MESELPNFEASQRRGREMRAEKQLADRQEEERLRKAQIATERRQELKRFLAEAPWLFQKMEARLDGISGHARSAMLAIANIGSQVNTVIERGDALDKSIIVLGARVKTVRTLEKRIALLERYIEEQEKEKAGAFRKGRLYGFLKDFWRFFAQPRLE